MTMHCKFNLFIHMTSLNNYMSMYYRQREYCHSCQMVVYQNSTKYIYNFVTIPCVFNKIILRMQFNNIYYKIEIHIRSTHYLKYVEPSNLAKYKV